MDQQGEGLTRLLADRMNEVGSPPRAPLQSCPGCGSPLRRDAERCYFCRADLRPKRDEAGLLGPRQRPWPAPSPEPEIGDAAERDDADVQPGDGPAPPGPSGCRYRGCSSADTLPCEACDGAYCPAHLERCQACGESRCPGDRGRCYGCERPYCWTHLEWFSSFGGSDHSASRCQECLAAWWERRWDAIGRLSAITALGFLAAFGAALLTGPAHSFLEWGVFGGIVAFFTAMLLAYR